jgi:hypothetical protein
MSDLQVLMSAIYMGARILRRQFMLVSGLMRAAQESKINFG